MSPQPPDAARDEGAPPSADGRSIRALFGDIAVYGSARALASALGVVFIPVYTRVLEVEEYGILENLSTLSFFIVTVFGFSLPTAITKDYGAAASDEERARVVSSGVFATALLGVFGALVVLAWRTEIGDLFIRRSASEEQTLILLLAGWSWLLLLHNVALTVFRADFRRRPYLIAALGVVTLGLVLNLVFVVGLRWGVAGIIAASCSAHLAAMVYSAYVLRKALSFRRVSWGTVRGLLSFGAPFAIAAVATYAMRSSDRAFIAVYVPDSLQRMALLAMAEKFMMLLSLFGFAFGMAWAPFVMGAGKGHSPLVYRRAFAYYVAITALLLVVCSVSSPLLLRLLTIPSYYPSAWYTAGVGISFCLDYLYYIGSVGLLLSGRSRALVPIVFVAAAIGLVLNFVLIPRFELHGAIWARNAAALAYNVMIFRYAEKQFFVGFPLGRAVLIYAIAFLAASLGLRYPLSSPLGLVVVLVAVNRLGFAQRSDVSAALRLVREGAAELLPWERPSS